MLKNHSSLIRFSPPFFINIFHYQFSLCYQLGKPELAEMVVQLQTALANIFPVAKSALSISKKYLPFIPTSSPLPSSSHSLIKTSDPSSSSSPNSFPSFFTLYNHNNNAGNSKVGDSASKMKTNSTINAAINNKPTTNTNPAANSFFLPFPQIPTPSLNFLNTNNNDNHHHHNQSIHITEICETPSSSPSLPLLPLLLPILPRSHLIIKWKLNRRRCHPQNESEKRVMINKQINRINEQSRFLISLVHLHLRPISALLTPSPPPTTPPPPSTRPRH